MPSQPDETAAHDLRNALAILGGIRAPGHALDDLLAVKHRLESALAKLEAPLEGTLARWYWEHQHREDHPTSGQPVEEPE